MIGTRVLKCPNCGHAFSSPIEFTPGVVVATPGAAVTPCPRCGKGVDPFNQ